MSARLLMIALLGLLVCGCGRVYHQEAIEERLVVATVNNYKMSASDFKDRVNFLLTSKYFAVEPNEAKAELLDELIARNVLLQEAQKQNLDKERAFMKEIERYWEESLLTLLLRKKSEEISETINVEDSEIIDEYSRMKRKVFAQLIILSNQADAEELSASGRDDFVQTAATLKQNIISAKPAKWWVLGDLPQYLEEPLFSLKPGQVSAVIACGNNWAVINMLRQEEMEIEPYRNVEQKIKKDIQKRKKEKMLAQWIEGLRSKASIKINRDILREINLE